MAGMSRTRERLWRPGTVVRLTAETSRSRTIS